MDLTKFTRHIVPRLLRPRASHPYPERRMGLRQRPLQKVRRSKMQRSALKGEARRRPLIPSFRELKSKAGCGKSSRPVLCGAEHQWPHAHAWQEAMQSVLT